MPFLNLVEYLCGVESYKPSQPSVHTPWLRLIRGIVAEFIGTAVLVFFCAASATAANQFTVPARTAANPLLIGAIQGFAVLALVAALSHISGGHINPAVTLGLFVMGKIPLARAIAYVIAQCCGGLIGAGLMAACVPRSQWNGLGATTPAPFMSDFEAFFFEFMVTGAFVFVVVATAADQQCKVVHLAPIPIGFALAIGVWAANPFTGGSLNPARSLGPAVWTGTYDEFWVYWVGPLGGALVASLIYRFVLIERQPPEEKPRDGGHAAPQGHGVGPDAAEKA